MHDNSLSLVRREEQLVVGTETVGIERVRLEKYIVTEQRTITINVRREEVRLVREPIDDDQIIRPLERDADLPPFMTVSEEQVVVSTNIVPVERVRLRKHLVTEHHQIDDTLRHEQIDLTD